MPHVKKDDTVVVLAGKDKDKRGKVLGVEPKRNKVLVDGVNVVRRHTKPRPPRFPQGGILEKTMPIDLSNVMLVCPQVQQADPGRGQGELRWHPLAGLQAL